MDPITIGTALKFLPLLLSAGSMAMGGGGQQPSPNQVVQQGPSGGVGGNHPAPIAAPGTGGMFGIGSELMQKNPMGALGGLAGAAGGGGLPLGLIPQMLGKQNPGGMALGGLFGSMFGR